MLRPFPLNQVQLLPRLFKDLFDLNLKYMMSLRSENLLEAFYEEAGLIHQGINGAYRVKMFGHTDDADDHHWGWESPTSEIRGTFTGHWLSAAARIIEATGNPEVKLKADHIVAEIARCQAKNGGGWAASIPDKYFRWLGEGQPTWAPQYVPHKTMMGLFAMYKSAGNTQALDIIDGLADWFLRWSAPFSREQFDNMLDTETGGMLELWSDLYGETNNPKYLTLMERYTRARLFDPLLAGHDILTNMHANTTIPEVHGAARAYEVTGDERWRKIVEAYWRFAVTERGTFVTGGQTSGEIWTPPFEFAARLGPKTQEHCVVYNMIRLADYLFRWTSDPVYSDYIERNLYNGILAAQNPQTGMVTYYLPLEAGAHKLWASPTHDFWCCQCTLVQAHTLHNAYIYYQDDEEMIVSQYIPSILRTEHAGVGIVIRQEDVSASAGNATENANLAGLLHRPQAWRFAFTVTSERPAEFTLKLRLPWWLSDGPRISINGETLAIQPGASEFVSIRWLWSNDRVVVELPKALTLVPLPDAPEVCAFMDGPIVLAGLCDEERTLVGDIEDASSMLMPHHEREWGNWLPNYRTRNQTRGLRFKPLYDIADEAYTVYFPVQPRA
jgi:DUF1680 family protein